MLARWERHREESGQELGYFGGHRRARTRRGRAADHPCVTCGTRARHWAQVHGTTGTDPSHYQPMCQKCHWAYDGVGARTAETKGPEVRREIALKAWSRRSPEARREISRKSWETRRRNMGKPVGDAPDRALAGPR